MASGSAPRLASSRIGQAVMVLAERLGGSCATMTSRNRSCDASTTSCPARMPTRTNRRARTSADRLIDVAPGRRPPRSPAWAAVARRPARSPASVSRPPAGRSRRWLIICSRVTTPSVASPRFAWVPRLLRTSSSIRNGFPRDSRATARAVRSVSGPGASRRVIASRYAASWVSGPSVMSLVSASAGQRSRICVRKGLAAASLSRYVRTTSTAGRLGRAQQLEEQRRAVDVPPLHVVDVQDERLSSRQRSQEVAQRREREPPDELRIGHLYLGDLADARYATEHREDTRQRAHATR